MSDTRSSANHDDVHVPGARRKMARSRGVGSGLAILLLGVWGALIPFVGPYCNFSYTPDKTWQWSAARGWLEVLPGGVAALGGLLLLVSASRAATVFGAWLGVAAGAWFVIGLPLAPLFHLGSPGSPAGTHRSVTTLETLAMFYGLGALILFFAATAFGRLSVVSQRDVSAAERRHESAIAEREAAEREQAERDADERERVHRADLERDSAERERIRRDGETGRGNAARADAGHNEAGRDAAGYGAATHGGPRHDETATAQPTNDQGGVPAQQAGAGYDPNAAHDTREYDPNAPQATQGYDPNATPAARGAGPNAPQAGSGNEQPGGLRRFLPGQRRS